MKNGLRRCGIPLGGIGTGTVEFRADGLFHEWQIMNNKPLGAGPEVACPSNGAYFFMQAKESGGKDAGRSFLLCEPPEHCQALNNPYDDPFVEYPEIKASARFPFTKLAFEFDGPATLRCSLNAWSPFVPLDVDASSLPAGIFDFEIKNISDKTQTVSLGIALKNFAGYTQLESESRIAFADNGVASLTFTRDGLPEDANDAGEICAAFRCLRPHEASFVAHPLNDRSIWEPLRESGRLENLDLAGAFTVEGNAGAEKIAQNSRGFAIGALCATFELKAGERIAPCFLLAWRFPNFHDMTYTREANQPASLIGSAYAKRFASAGDVVSHVFDNAASLRSRTEAFSSAFYASDLPPWLLDAVSAQFGTLRKSSWHAANGDFGIWEGLGLCGLQTTDVTYYGSFAVLQLFPELELSQMRLLVKNISEPGKIPHSMPGNFSCGDFDDRIRKDLVPQFVLMVWRDYLWLGDKAWIGEMLPVVKQAFEYYKSYDRDGDGLPENEGPDQTYDQLPLKGVSASVGFQYAASLMAAVQLARAVGDEACAKDCEAKAGAAMKRLEKLLWTGSYYRISHDPAKGVGNDGVMVDQLVGDWFMRQTCGKGLVEDVKARSASKTIMEACFQPQGYLANCAWPFGGERTRIGRHTANQADWAWSGTEYAFAAQLALLGLRDEALRLCRAVYDRHERCGLRFKHIECGQHYYRVLSVWAAYNALCGFSFDQAVGIAIIDLSAGVKSFVFFASSGWGEVHADGDGIKLKVCAGALELKELRLKSSTFKTLSAEGVSASLEGSTLALRFANGVKLANGESLTLEA